MVGNTAWPSPVSPNPTRRASPAWSPSRARSAAPFFLTVRSGSSLDPSSERGSFEVDFRDTAEEVAFRDEVRTWLSDNLVGEFARIGGGRGTADEEHWETRLEWERKLGAAGWIGLSWPAEYGGRGAPFSQQAIFSEEYAKANAPGRITFFGEGLLGPTL